MFTIKPLPEFIAWLDNPTGMRLPGTEWTCTDFETGARFAGASG
jgi:hypothetical protein